MKLSKRIGLGFGATSGVITTLGLITGLAVGTHSKTAVISGILTIAIADALSDAFGIHVSEESAGKLSKKELWSATYNTFVSKFVFAITFLLPVILLDMLPAVLVSIIWGLALVASFNYLMAREEKKKPWPVVKEHMLIAVFVLAASFVAGGIINLFSIN